MIMMMRVIPVLDRLAQAGFGGLGSGCGDWGLRRGSGSKRGSTSDACSHWLLQDSPSRPSPVVVIEGGWGGERVRSRKGRED